MSARELIILGSGGHAAVVAESAARSGWRLIAIASRERPETAGPFAGAEWLGDPDTADARTRIAGLVARGARVHAAVGDGVTRERWFTTLGGRPAFASVIDPAAVISPSARIVDGASVGARAVVQARASVGACAIVNTGAIVEHDSIVGDFAHVSPGAILCGSVRIGMGAQVGAGAVVIPGRIVGDRAIVGAGAVVVRDVAEAVTAVGVPARARG